MNEFNKKIYYYLLITGLIFTFLGVYGVFNPLFFSTYFIYVLAFFFFTSGVKNFIKCFEHRNIKCHIGYSILIGVLDIVIALSLISNPLGSQVSIAIYAGIFLTIKGIFIILNSISNKKLIPTLSNLSFGSGLIDIFFGILIIILPIFATSFISLCFAWYILFSGINLFAAAISFKQLQK